MQLQIQVQHVLLQTFLLGTVVNFIRIHCSTCDCPESFGPICYSIAEPSGITNAYLCICQVAEASGIK